ncbi:hypothetical protein KKG16_05270, partial [Patescibacteria group bacterium]|nr:hypothetical protein [Patescibacteria group bacterium]
MSSCITPSEAQGSNSAPSAERQVVSEELELAKYNLEVRRIIEKPHYKQIDIDVYSEQNWVGADRPVMNWSESVSVTHGY